MRRAASSPEAIVREGLEELSVACTRKHIRLFLTYLTELKKWNKAYNLTSLKTDEDIIIKHFLDSLLYLRALPQGTTRIMDVGSGAGFPAVPIKIVRPEIVLYLVEPSRKRANFLRQIVRLLGLVDAHVVEKRIEDIDSLIVDVAVTRALFDIKEFSLKVLPLIRKGGSLIMSKGPKVNEELKELEGRNLAYELLTVPLPLSETKRVIVTIKKPDSETHLPVKSDPGSVPHAKAGDVCVNAECRLRKAGCQGFEGCPGFKAKT